MDIPLNQHGEGGFVAFDILFQPRDVIGLRHLPNYVRRNKIGTGFLRFSAWPMLCPFSEALFPSLICFFQMNQLGKGCFRALPVVIPQQFHVAHIGHLTIYCRWTRNQTFNFSTFCCQR